MNGRSAPPPIPPSVQQARRQQPQGPRAWTGLWGTRIVGGLVALAVIGVVAAKVATQMQKKAPKATVTESTLEPAWGRQAFQYKAEEPVLPREPKPPADTISPELARLRAELAAMKQAIEDLKNRKPATSPTVTTGDKSPAKTAPVPRATPAPLLFTAHDLSQEAPAQGKKPGGSKEYTLAPGATKLVGILETVINSDVPGYLTCRISTNVYDTATGRHLLVPQGSTVLGHDQSADLLYGNTRLPTVSLTLALPDGRSVDLGRAPIVDQQGAAGLTGDVDSHWGRLIGAVLIGGALRGGQQALQTSLADVGGAGQVVNGIGQVGSQAGQQRAGRALDTRPTITVAAGSGCVVLLIKPLSLPAMWE